MQEMEKKTQMERKRRNISQYSQLLSAKTDTFKLRKDVNGAHTIIIISHSNLKAALISVRLLNIHFRQMNNSCGAFCRNEDTRSTDAVAPVPTSETTRRV